MISRYRTVIVPKSDAVLEYLELNPALVFIVSKNNVFVYPRSLHEAMELEPCLLELN